MADKTKTISTEFPAAEFFEILDRTLQDRLCEFGILEKLGVEKYEDSLKRFERYLVLGSEGYTFKEKIGIISSSIGPYRGRFLDENMKKLDENSVYR